MKTSCDVDPLFENSVTNCNVVGYEEGKVVFDELRINDNKSVDVIDNTKHVEVQCEIFPQKLAI